MGRNLLLTGKDLLTYRLGGDTVVVPPKIVERNKRGSVARSRRCELFGCSWSACRFVFCELSFFVGGDCVVTCACSSGAPVPLRRRPGASAPPAPPHSPPGSLQVAQNRDMFCLHGGPLRRRSRRLLFPGCVADVLNSLDVSLAWSGAKWEVFVTLRSSCRKMVECYVVIFAVRRRAGPGLHASVPSFALLLHT